MRAEHSSTLADSLSLFCSPVPSFLLLTVMTESEIDELSEEFRIELQSTAGDAEYDMEDELLGEDTTANPAPNEDMPARQQQMPAPRDQQRQIPPALPAFLAQQQQHHVLPQMPAPPQMQAMPAPPQMQVMPAPPQMQAMPAPPLMQAMPAPPQMQALHAHQMSTPPQMPAPPQMLTLMPPPYAPPNRHLVDILKDLRLIKIN